MDALATLDGPLKGELLLNHENFKLRKLKLIEHTIVVIEMHMHTHMQLDEVTKMFSYNDISLGLLYSMLLYKIIIMLGCMII